MIAADSSSLIDYLKEIDRSDCRLIHKATRDNLLVLPPIVITEILSNMISGSKFWPLRGGVILLDITDGYWERAGLMREKIISKGIKVKIPDTLIAQSCIDHKVPLITADADFQKFTAFGLKLAK